MVYTKVSIGGRGMEKVRRTNHLAKEKTMCYFNTVKKHMHQIEGLDIYSERFADDLEYLSDRILIEAEELKFFGSRKARWQFEEK